MSVLGRRSQRGSGVIEQNITNVLAEVGPLLRMDHYSIEIAQYTEATGQLMLRIGGNCPDCQLSPATFMPAITAHLKLRVPEVREVRVIGE
jgi:Fe-S cluster biogenesis protein NfuA